MSEVVLIDQLSWGFDGGGPRLAVKGRYEEVDPFPCYHHDLKLVEDTLEIAKKAFPIDPARGPKVSVLAYDTKGHVNGWANVGYDYSERDEDGNYAWRLEIAMMGKRTPIHPAMTRFIMAHEYGHSIEDVLEKKLFGPNVLDPLRTEYAALRGVEANNDYGSRNWHTNTGEIFADDFRILLAKVEVEHWPHPGVERPENVPAVKKWWAKMKKKHAYKEEKL